MSIFRSSRKQQRMDAIKVSAALHSLTHRSRLGIVRDVIEDAESILAFVESGVAVSKITPRGDGDEDEDLVDDSGHPNNPDDEVSEFAVVEMFVDGHVEVDGVAIEDDDGL